MARLSPLRPARVIDWDEVLSISDQEIVQTLSTNDEFNAASTLRAQVVIAHRLLHIERRPAVPLGMIGRFFDMNKNAVKDHVNNYKRFGDDPGRCGRPPILPPEAHETLIQHILAEQATGYPCTMGDLKEFIMNTWQEDLDSGTIWRSLDRDPRIKACQGHPMEDKRMQVTNEQLMEHFQRLFEVVSGVPAHFVFNMDEMGHQDWADRRIKTCYVSSEVKENQVYVPVSRAGKRITLVACIAADGSYLKPMIVIPRKTVDPDLFLLGWTDEKVVIRHQPKGFINTEIFDAWMAEIFLPELARRREQYQYAGPAVLLLDNCSAHAGETFETQCEPNHLRPLFLPPHASNQLQPCDLCLFGVTKNLAVLDKLNMMEAANIQTKHIVKVLTGLLKAARPQTIVASFRNAGIALIAEELEGGQRCLLCKIQPELARALQVDIQTWAAREMPEGDVLDDDPLAADDRIEMELYLEEFAELIGAVGKADYALKPDDVVPVE